MFVFNQIYSDIVDNELCQNSCKQELGKGFCQKHTIPYCVFIVKVEKGKA